MSITLERKLSDFIRLPTVSHPPAFQEMAARTGWSKSPQETFDLASEWLLDWLTGFADEVGSQPVALEGFTGHNIWGLVRGEANHEAILLQGHFDVVDVAGNFAPEIRNGRLHGRGASDMKGAVVTALAALEDLVHRNARPALDTYILLTCEEEVEARGAFTFAAEPPDWAGRVKFALCLESAYAGQGLEFAIRHPGIVCVVVETPLSPVAPQGTFWRVRIEPGRKHVLHASREPLTLDPNTVLLAILRAFPTAHVTNFASDRPVTGAANATSAFAECVLSTPLNQSALEQICSKELERHLARVQTPDTAALRADTHLTLTKTGPDRLFDVGPFAAQLLDFRAATKARYTNAVYGQPPFTIAAVQIHEGCAQAKVDIRTDTSLRVQLGALLAEHFSPPTDVAIKWNDPGLEDPALADHPRLLQLQRICEQYRPTRIMAHSGWTEAAVWSTLLHIPTVVGGPGQRGQAHTQEEFVELESLAEMMKILQEYLLTVV